MLQYSPTPWVGLAALIAMFVLPFLPAWLFEGPRAVKHWPHRHVCGVCKGPVDRRAHLPIERQRDRSAPTWFASPASAGGRSRTPPAGADLPEAATVAAVGSTVVVCLAGVMGWPGRSPLEAGPSRRAGR
jgi:hypothetical protein